MDLNRTMSLSALWAIGQCHCGMLRRNLQGFFAKFGGGVRRLERTLLLRQMACDDLVPGSEAYQQKFQLCIIRIENYGEEDKMLVASIPNCLMAASKRGDQGLPQFKRKQFR